MSTRITQVLAAGIVLLGVTPSTSAKALELRCKGTEYIYENGFGNGLPIRLETVRLVTVDLNSNLMAVDTVFGQRKAQASISERAFEVTLSHELEYKGIRIYGESVYINRATGEASARYLLSTDRDGRGYMAFVGECAPGTTKF